MSRLRAQVERLSVSASEPPAQIAALEAKLARAENAAALAQRELADLKRNLARTAESAVKAGSERASAETKLRTLEREAAEAAGARDELARRADALDKKVATLTTLHKEQDARMQALRRDKERVDKELAGAQEEASRLRKKAAADASGAGADDEGVDELEDEERGRLAKRIRELEAENTDLRRGIWHDRRKEMQVGPEEASRGFRDVDLPSPSLRKSAAGLGDFLASGLHVLTGGTAAAAAGGGEQDELLLEDDAMEFDEDAFRKAQEEEGKKRIERIKEIKRGLKNWAGWRLDLVESRRGGGEGIGEIFEV